MELQLGGNNDKDLSKELAETKGSIRHVCQNQLPKVS